MPPIDIILENKTLKNEFTIRNLDLPQVWIPTPDNLELENRQLHHLLEWVDKYRECPDRKQLEAQGYLFPPIHYDIDPDSDWFRFERWMQGLPVRMRLRDQLPGGVKIRKSTEIPEEEIEAALDELLKQLEKIKYRIGLINDVPPRLVYEHLLELLEEVKEIVGQPGWYFDGCGGCCPYCFQRPWCESGCNCCWDEDREAGHIVFPDNLRRYVSPSPVSLEILAARQAEEDRKFEEVKAKNPGEIRVERFRGFGDDDELKF